MITRAKLKTVNSNNGYFLDNDADLENQDIDGTVRRTWKSRISRAQRVRLNNKNKPYDLDNNADQEYLGYDTVRRKFSQILCGWTRQGSVRNPKETADSEDRMSQR
ncbi:MAG: hypothetical protein LBT40_03905 [Deltaproteobacteria bacterium]|nr:hypothetical protein [Deltaproteobacteria bacterium]